MKLAIVTHNVLKGDGQGRVIYEIVRHALRAGCEVAVVADRVEQSIVDAGAQWIETSPTFDRPLLLKVWDFARRADQIVPDLKSRGYVTVGNGFSLRVPHDLNIAHMVHGAWMAVSARLSAPVGRLRRRYQNLYTRSNCVWEKQAFASAGRVIAVSDQVRENLVGIGVSRDRIEVVLNGVDTGEFHPGPESRIALGLPQKAPLAIFVGDIRSPLKNLPTALRAMTQIPSLHLAVVGDAAGSPFPSLAAQLGVADRVHFLGRRGDVARLMRASDFCVFPSHCDAFGLVILEAMASGLPVLASSAAGASQLVSDGCGMVLAPEQQDAWTRGMTRLASSPADRRMLGTAARIIAENHSFEHMAEEYLSLFRRVECRR